MRGKNLFKENITKEMIDHYEKRTKYHIDLVKKYLKKIIDLNDSRLDNDVLEDEKSHDESKYGKEEHDPYIHISWKYYLKSQNKEYKIAKETQDLMNAASLHHIKTNKHHPEYWIKKDNDATNMPLNYIASMVADWCGMSEELGNSPIEWADKNVNVKWKFNDKQVKLIYDLLDRVWE